MLQGTPPRGTEERGVERGGEARSMNREWNVDQGGGAMSIVNGTGPREGVGVGSGGIVERE